MISDTTKYALQILAHLAKNPDRLLTGGEISDATKIPANYLGKILNQLRKGGFVESQKGWGGGFSLKNSARKRPIADVFKTFEGAEKLQANDCAFGIPRCKAEKPCPLHEHWKKIRATFREMMADVKIGDFDTRPQSKTTDS